MAKGNQANKAEEENGPSLKERVENMEACLSKMAHFSGQQRILDEFGIKRWELTKKDMGKYKD